MRQKPSITIVKASAGSGKTHRLTKEYIAAIGKEEPGAFRGVTAITFTNKAAAEMKGRIIEELSQQAATNAEAKGRLTAILQQYGSFAVGTIDSYLRGVSTTMAAETGDHGGRVELDEASVMEEITSRVLEKAKDNEVLLGILTDMSLRQIRQGQSWNPSTAITESARHFLDEEYLTAARRGAIPRQQAEVKDIAGTIATSISSFEESLTTLGRRGLAALEAEGSSPEQTPGKSRSPLIVLYAWSQGIIKEPSAKLRETAEKCGLSSALSIADEAERLFGAPYRDYRTCLLLQESLPTLLLHASVVEATREVLAEKDITLLRRSGDTLAALLSSADGATLAAAKEKHHTTAFLLDEAQDTSRQQWENIGAMMRQALLRGGEGFVVGDIKQSIYRWRNSDWSILDNEIENTLDVVTATKETLAENWRSAACIVDFNNEVFSCAAKLLADTGFDSPTAALIGRIYGDSVQTVPSPRSKTARDGQVRLLRAEPYAKKEVMTVMMTEEVRRLASEGLRYNEITILVRTGKEGALAAKALLEAGIPVVTEDSLTAGGVTITRRIAAALRHEAYPEDDTAALACFCLDARFNLSQAGTLYEKVLSAAQQAQMQDGYAPYVMAMADAALQWQYDNGSDIAAFVDWWRDTGSLKSISCDGGDAVRIMTIHKSKGLSLEAVVVPYLRESFTSGPLLAPSIWCRHKGKFAPLGPVPLKAFEGRLKNTDFEEDYKKERMLQAVDAMNTAYVALTRAKKRLTVIIPGEPQKEANGAPTSVASVIGRIFSQRFDADGVYQNGTPLPHKGNIDEGGEGPAAPLPSFTSPIGKASLRGKAEDYFRAIENQ